MWLLIFLFFGMTFVLGWTLFGYLIFVWSIGLFRGRSRPPFPSEWPSMSVIVPCYNEESGILEKLEDIRGQDYPRYRLEVVFVDGGSSDRTIEILSAALKDDAVCRIETCSGNGKVSQINHVLPRLRGEIVVNSDADSRLSSDALKWIAAEFAANSDVWVVGAYCRPDDNALEVEKYYWSAQNKGRFMETDARTSSIVIAQCYGFRRELLSAFPDDVVADDIYIALLANSQRHIVVYSRYATAVETRCPTSYSEFLPHKFRKSNAFLRETLRFLYVLPEMGPFCRMVLLTRIAQQLLLPLLGFFWLLVAGVLLTLFRFDIVIIGSVLLVALFVVTSWVIAFVRLPAGTGRHSLLTMVKGYVLTNLILFGTAVSYPFFRQGSCYTRLETEANAQRRDES